MNWLCITEANRNITTYSNYSHRTLFAYINNALDLILQKTEWNGEVINEKKVRSCLDACIRNRILYNSTLIDSGCRTKSHNLLMRIRTKQSNSDAKDLRSHL